MKIFIKFLTTMTFIFAFGMCGSANAATFISVPNAQNAQQAQTINLVKTYFEALNKKDMNLFFSIMDSNVEHDIDDGSVEHGIGKFKVFMQKGADSFNEKLDNIVIMVSDDGKYAAARWIDHGVYYKDYAGLDVRASNQKYTLPGGHFFEVRDGKISCVATYYNATDFMKQINSK
jgi:steroid delta-isomerase-like uncharacterized protein